MCVGDLHVTEPGRIEGMIGGTLTVTDVRVEVAAMVGGDIVAGEGADVVVTGMVGGRAIELGGTIHGEDLSRL